MKCSVCKREREIEKTIDLNPEERKLIAEMTREAIPESYHYCKPCWSVASDRRQGAQLLRGMMQVGLSRHGVQNAGEIAERYYRFFVDNAKKPLS